MSRASQFFTGAPLLVLVTLCSLPCRGQFALTVLQGPSNEPYTQSNDVQSDSVVVASTPAWGVNFQAVSLDSWLTFNTDCTNPSGAIPAVIGVTPASLFLCIDPGQVADNGYYVGLIEVTAAGYPALRIPIRLTKFPTGNLSASPDAANLSGASLSASITVSADPTGQNNNNGGFSELDFTTALGRPNPAEGNWLSFVQSNSKTPGRVDITVDPARLQPASAGTYTNKLIFKDTKYGDVKTAVVNLTVQAQDFKVTRVLPHLAVGGEWITTFIVVNTGDEPGQFTVDFHAQDGSSLSIQIGSANLSVLTGTIPAHGAKFYEAGNSSQGLRAGWGLVTADAPVDIQALFRRRVPSGAHYEAAVSSTPGGSGFVIPFDATTFAETGDPFYTGFAVANMDAVATANVVCTSRDDTGVVIPNGVVIPPLVPLGQYANYLFPALTGKRGTLDCVSNTRIAPLAFRFIGTDAFASLPVFLK